MKRICFEELWIDSKGKKGKKMKLSNNKQLLVNLAASVIAVMVQFIISFWVSPYVIGKLGESAYGFITLAINFTEYATFLTVAVNSMASRFISIEYNKGNIKSANEYFSSVFWFNAVLAVVIFLLSVILIFNIERIINIDDYMVRDVKITFFLTFINLITSFTSTAYVSTTFITNRMDINAYVQIFSRLIKLFVTIGCLVMFTPRIYYVSFGNLIATLFVLIVYCFIRKRLVPEFKIRLDNFHFSKLITVAKSGLWMLLSNISGLLLNGMDLLIANLMVSQSAMGRLSVSKQIPIALSSLLGYLTNIFSASFTQLVALDKKDELIDEVNFTLRILGFFLTVPFAGIIIYGTEFLLLWLPNDVYVQAEILEVYILMMLTLSNNIVNAYMYSIHSLYIAVNKVKMYAVVIFACSIVSILTTLFLTKFTSLGVYAIAGTSTIILSLVNLFWVPLYIERALGLKTFTLFRSIEKSYLGLLITCFVFFCMKPLFCFNSWMYFLLSVFIAAVFGYALNMFVILNSNDRMRITQVMKTKRGRK